MATWSTCLQTVNSFVHDLMFMSMFGCLIPYSTRRSTSSLTSWSPYPAGCNYPCLTPASTLVTYCGFWYNCSKFQALNYNYTTQLPCCIPCCRGVHFWVDLNALYGVSNSLNLSYGRTGSHVTFMKYMAQQNFPCWLVQPHNLKHPLRSRQVSTNCPLIRFPR